MVIKADKVVSVEFKLIVPVECTDNELLAWLRFELHDNCDLSLTNPLSRYAINPVPFSVVSR